MMVALGGLILLYETGCEALGIHPWLAIYLAEPAPVSASMGLSVARIWSGGVTGSINARRWPNPSPDGRKM